jgi:hypothetical protein
MMRHVKQDPVSLAVAVRTELPDPAMAWAVMTTDRSPDDGEISGCHQPSW